METPVKQTPAASSEIVKLVRKLRWVGLEEKADQLEKELEQLPATDTVLAIQSETDKQRAASVAVKLDNLSLGATNFVVAAPAPNRIERWQSAA